MADSLSQAAKYELNLFEEVARLTNRSIVPPQARTVLLMEYEYMRKPPLLSYPYHL